MGAGDHGLVETLDSIGIKMKIGLHSTGYPGLTPAGGVATYTRELAHGLCELGHEVHVLISGEPVEPARDGPVWVHKTRSDYFPIVERILPGSGACYYIGATMRRLATEYGLDIVEFPNWEGVGLWYALRRPTPLIVRLYTSSIEAGQINGTSGDRSIRWDVSRERWLSLMADTLVTHSQAHRQFMAEELAIDSGRIAVVPLGVIVDRGFRRAPRQGTDLTVVYLGRLENRKGTIDLLRAAPEVLREVPEAAVRPHWSRSTALSWRADTRTVPRGGVSLGGSQPDHAHWPIAERGRGSLVADRRPARGALPV